jgi:hypothetical protein
MLALPSHEARELELSAGAPRPRPSRQWRRSCSPRCAQPSAGVRRRRGRHAAPPDLAVELQLRGVRDATAARGYPIKVVLFANLGDTGGEPEPLEDTQTYATTVSDDLEAIGSLRAPVLVVTPHRLGLGGKQPRDGTPTPITRPLAAELARGLPLAKKADGNALARTAMVAVRRLAAAGRHPLPKRIPPAEQNPKGILGAAGPRERKPQSGRG